METITENQTISGAAVAFELQINWDQLSRQLQAGQYEQVASEFARLRGRSERRNEAVLSGSLSAVEQLCLVCAQYQQTVSRTAQREQQLQQQIFSILATMRQQEPPLVGAAAEAMPHPSFWQRIGRRLRLFGEEAARFPSALPPQVEPAAAESRLDKLHVEEATELESAEEAAVSARSIAVHCLGDFRVYQDDNPIEVWPSGRGKSVFKYLVNHRARPINKEVLMDLFWSEASPDAARNNLNVAIYGLRKALREICPDASIILFQDDCYLLNPEVEIWLDVDVFVTAIAQAQELIEQDQLSKALLDYHTAESLYQGEFLAEDRYEEWLLPQRHRLQEQYLNILDYLSRHYFAAEDYRSCITYCQKKLAIEGCCEETQRRLMRCYGRQNQHYLALRQYHHCVEVLREELDMPPDPETVKLYGAIRRRVAV